jgi:adenylate kinase
MISRTCLLLFCLIFTRFALEAKELPPALLIIGPPGSCEGFLIVKASKAFGLPHISSANLLLDSLGRESPFADRIREYLRAKGAIPDDLILEMLYPRLEEPDTSRGCVLDGIPRSEETAKKLFRDLKNNFHFCVIFIKVDDNTLKLRQEGRLICPECGAVYHPTKNPPRVPMVCDICKHPLLQRGEDSSENVQHCMDDWHHWKDPVLAYFKQEGVLYEMNGDLPIDSLFEEIQKIFQKFLDGETTSRRITLQVPIG